MKIGYIGLGKMGANMALRLLEHGIEVVVWNRTVEKISNLKSQISNKNLEKRFIAAENLEDLVDALPLPRIIWLMLPAGDVIDQMLEKLSPLLSIGDIIIEGGNSFYKDTLERGKLLAKKKIRFMDIGVSGGPGGAKSGACLMIGGKREDFEEIEELIKAAAAPNAYTYFGSLGAGHFVKMVHNGIEYGMMQSIAEGAAVLKFSPYSLDLGEVFRVYNNRSVIESRLVGWMQEALVEDNELSAISPIIQASGEAEWTVKTAKEEGVEAPIIEKSLEIRQNSDVSSKNKKSAFRNKTVSALRGKFGQHDVLAKK